MGYTHYFPRQRAFTQDEWTSIEDYSRKIIDLSSVPICREYDEPDSDPVIDADHISFNGREDDGHETFLITRAIQSDFAFCKTACKPYDEVVTAILAICHAVAPGALKISSDGRAQDWEDGLKLAQAAAPSLTITFPVAPKSE